MRLHQQIRREQGRHTDDWLITYADTITLLLCLFVVILSIKTSGKTVPWDSTPPINQPVASADIFEGHPPFPAIPRVVAETGDNHPETAGDVAGPNPDLPGRVNPAAAKALPESIVAVANPAPDTPRRLSLASEGMAPLGSEARPLPPGAERPASVTEPSASATASLPAVVERLKAQGTEAVEQQGDRITTVQINSAAFFASGYAVLSGAGKSILRDVAVTLKSSEFAAYHISIEGHTDDTPISTPQFQSNWELSTARAAAVVRFFLEQGIAARKLSAAGYADTFPIAPNRNADGIVIPDNQARNRRVVIRLEKTDTAER